MTDKKDDKGPQAMGKPQEMFDEKTPTRRVRFLIVNPTDFLFLFTKGLVFAKRTHVFEGVPDDAEVVSMSVDHVRGGIILVVKSQEYEPIPMTVLPPVQEVKIRIGVEGATKKRRK